MRSVRSVKSEISNAALITQAAVKSVLAKSVLAGSALALSAAIAIGVAGMTAAGDASAQYRASNTQVRSAAASSTRYVSRTTRRVAVPVRNQRVYSAPRGATLLRSRYWDPRTRWMVDSRTRSTYSVLSNGEVWFMEPSSGWAYTVDRYGRVYGADPRNRSVYAFSSLHSWSGDLFYFFDYFSPYDGYYTVRDYDWFYSSYYGRRTPLYDYGYAYNTMWNDFDDYWFSNSFRRSFSFRYYEPAYIRYDTGWNSRYYYNSLPAVYIAPCYSYTVVNNTVVVNNNYYTNNNIVNNGGNRGLPTAEQAAVQLSAQITAPVVVASNEIPAQQLADAGISAPVESVKEVALEAMAPAPASEPSFEVPGLPAVTENPASEPVAAQVQEQAPVTPDSPVAETQPDVQMQQQDAPVDSGSFSEPVREIVQEPAASESAREEQMTPEPVYQEPAREETKYEEPAYQEPAYQEPAREEPTYQEPAYQEPLREEPAYEEPAYQEPAREESMIEEPAYQEPAREEQRYEEPSYEAPQQQEQRYEEPSYEAPQQQEQRYEEPSYEAPQQQEQRYEEPSYEAPQQQEQRYEEPSYEAPQQQEQRYEEPSYEAPQQQEQRYEEPQQQEQRYEEPQQQEQRYEEPAPQSTLENGGG